MGLALAEATMDSKGRIVIPEEVRRELGLIEGSKLRVTVGDEGSVAILKQGVEADEFIRRTEGFLKAGSEVKVADPLRLKEIWTRS